MIRVSLRLGAMTAGGVRGQLKALDEYGRRLGLGVSSHRRPLGRSQQREGSWASGWGKTPGRAKSPSRLCWELTPASAYAAQLIDEACAAVEPFGPHAEGLITLARYVLERNR